MTEKECESLNSIMNQIDNLTVDEKENIFRCQYLQHEYCRDGFIF